MMSYEAQIAGLGDAPPGQALRGRAIRLMQRRSYPELLERRAAAVAAVREHADLEFVNGGGTGSVAATAADPSVTEVTAGSGLYGPTLFDAYRAGGRPRRRSSRCPWSAGPAPRHRDRARRRLDRVRPGRAVPAAHAVAAGRAASYRATRAPARCRRRCSVPGADALRPGDRVWFRHAKAGELCEHVNEVQLVDGDTATPAPDVPRRGSCLPGVERRWLPDAERQGPFR